MGMGFNFLINFYINNIKGVRISFLIILLMPLFLININAYHDWGGDFAQYIQQGINIIDAFCP